MITTQVFYPGGFGLSYFHSASNYRTASCSADSRSPFSVITNEVRLSCSFSSVSPCFIERYGNFFLNFKIRIGVRQRRSISSFIFDFFMDIVM